jgi:CDP-paratose 2-epimerase
MNVLVTGGAGFIGSHLAEQHLKKGEDVIVVDNFSRTKFNIKYLIEKYPNIYFRHGDISDPETFNGIMDDIDVVYHCAAQVAVTNSITNPRQDYNTNATGTFNLCEAIRKADNNPPIVFCSTNKVYGDLDLPTIQTKKRYLYWRIHGIAEDRPLETNCPYGGSKIIAETILDTYHKTYNLKVVKARMSCIYGTRQFGCEDQGWISWFAINTLKGNPITIYGDGKQVRDVLYVTDQNRAFELLAKKIKKTDGGAFNLGGGTDYTISLCELFDLIEDITGKRSEVKYADWRLGDQKVYISDTTKIKEETGWKPKVDVKTGVKKLIEWTEDNITLF